MALTLEAIYENGVFVPVERPALAERERVRLVVEPVQTKGNGADVVRYRRTRRMKVDPALAREIASDPAFLPEES